MTRTLPNRRHLFAAFYAESREEADDESKGRFTGGGGGEDKMGKMTMGWRAIAGAGVLAVGLSAGGAQAQDVPPGCTATGNPNGAVAGALLGGVAGALLGNAVGGRHKAPGTIIGGVTGAAAGAAIGGSQPCPDGYVYRAAPVREEVPPPPRDDFWYGAPASVHERIAFLRARVQKLDDDGWLSPRESTGLLHRLGEIAHREDAIRDDNGGHLPPEARDHLEGDLDGVAHRLRWREYRTQHAEE
jgi:hypothetical protein